MGARAETDREDWSRVLTAGGFTAVPRWVPEPVAGVAQYEAVVPEDVAAEVRELARQSAVPVSAVLLAAHAKVLAALSGEQEVVTGYAAGLRGGPLPCRLTVPTGPWRALVSEANRVEAELLAHRRFPVEELRRELGVTGPSYEIVFDPAGEEAGLVEDAALGVGWSDRDGRLAVRSRYRTQVLNTDCAA